METKLRASSALSAPTPRPSHLLAGILVIAAALRLIGFGAFSLWYDEAYTAALISESQSFVDVIQITAIDVHPPLYYLLLRMWTGVVGLSEAGLRSFSVVAGILSLVALYKLASKFVNPYYALIAPLLLTLSRSHIKYSQEARMYTLLLLFGCLSALLFLRLLEENPKRIQTAGYFFTTIALLYTHVYGAIIVLAQAMVVLLVTARSQEWEVIRRWMPRFVAIGVAFLPWIAILVRQFSRGAASSSNPPATLNDLAVAGELMLGSGLLISACLALLAMMSVIIPSLVSISDPSKSVFSVLTNPRTALLVFWVGLSLAVPFSLSHVGSTAFYSRYALLGAPAAFILATLGWQEIKTRQRTIGYMLLCVVLIASVANVAGYYDAGMDQREVEAWDEAAAFIDSQPTQNVPIIYDGAYVQVPFEIYSDEQHQDIGYPDTYRKTDQFVEQSGYQPAVLADTDRVWVVFSHSQNRQELRAELKSQGFSTVETQSFEGVTIYQYRRDA